MKNKQEDVAKYEFVAVSSQRQRIASFLCINHDQKSIRYASHAGDSSLLKTGSRPNHLRAYMSNED